MANKTFDALPASHPLFGASLKLVRARKHIDEFSDVLKEFLSTNPFEHSPVIYDVAKGYYSTQVTKMVNPPSILGAVAGDVVHNLRCVFDLVASKMVGGENRSGIAFPVSSDSNDYKVSGKLKNASLDALELIKSFQPFSSKDNNDLLQIHRMDIWDKHRVITTVAVGATSLETEIVNSSVVLVNNGAIKNLGLYPSGIRGRATTNIKISNFKAKQGQYINFPPSPPIYEFKPKLNFAVFLEKTADWKDEEALPALERLFAYTDTAIKKFCSLFPNEPLT